MPPYTSRSQLITEPGLELKAGFTEECCLLVHPLARSQVLLSEFPYTAQDRLPRDAAAHSRCPTSVNNQNRDGRNGSAAKRTFCSSIGPEFSAQHPCGAAPNHL